MLQMERRGSAEICCPPPGSPDCARAGLKCKWTCDDRQFGTICCECDKSCFPAGARVSLETGETITMAELKRGHTVKTGEFKTLPSIK